MPYPQHLSLAVLCGALAVSAAPLAHANGFDPKRCSSIRNVDLPYTVSADGRAMVFTGAAAKITVADDAVTVAGRRFSEQPLTGQYAASLRGFLGAARAMPLISARFGRETAAGMAGKRDPELQRGFVASLTSMCRSVLEVSDLQERIKQAFPGFVAPVKISLSR